MTSPTAQFIFFEPEEAISSRRDLELQDQAARAHAARISHAKRRKAQRKRRLSLPPQIAGSAVVTWSKHTAQTNLSGSQDSQLSPRSFIEKVNDDPFDAFAVHGLPGYVVPLLLCAARAKWSKLRPTPHDSGSNPVSKAWMAAAVESPIALHSFAYAMLRTMLLTRETKEPEHTFSLQHFAEALTKISEEIKRIEDGTSTTSDNVIIGIAALSAHGEPQHPSSRGDPFDIPASPLAKTQNIHIYGSATLQPAHMQAVYHLVGRMGGLQHLSLDGLSDVLEVCDLVYATRAHCRPGFPWRGTDSHIDHGKPSVLKFPAKGTSKAVATDFQDVEETLQLVETFHRVRDVLAELDQYYSQGCIPDDLPPLLAARNAVQHHLLCIPLGYTVFPYNFEKQHLHTICRLGLLLFSNLVLFPLALESGVASRLTCMLSVELSTASTVQGIRLWDKHPRLFVWAVLLGIISSFGTSEHYHLIACLRNIVSNEQARTWEVVEKEMLLNLVWWPHVCSKAAKRVWIQLYANGESKESSAS